MRGYANAVPVTWEGVTYRSISECARALGLTPPTIAKRLREGMPLDDPRKKGGAETIVVEGEVCFTRRGCKGVSSEQHRVPLPPRQPSADEYTEAVIQDMRVQGNTLQILADVRGFERF